MDQPTEILIQELRDEIAILKMQNEMLLETIQHANTLMASVPLWTTSARDIAAFLGKKVKEHDTSGKDQSV